MPLRLIQVGVGAWGASWAGVVHAAPDWELAAVVDLDESALARSGLPQKRQFSSLQDAVAAVPADAALVAVPPAAHLPVAAEALAAGLHCLIEKPLAATLDDARALLEAAKRSGRLAMVSQNLRFSRGARTVRELVGGGEIGQIEAAFIRFFRTPLFTGWRLELEEPLLTDMAIHHFDQVRGLLGLEPVRVRATSSNPSWSPFTGNASAVAELETEDGSIVSYTGSWAPRGPETSWDGDWSVHGEHGWIGWSHGRVLLAPPGVTLERTLRRRLRRRPLPRTVPLVPVSAEERAGALAELAAAIREGREPEGSVRDNIHSLALVVAAISSARTGLSVETSSLAG